MCASASVQFVQREFSLPSLSSRERERGSAYEVYDIKSVCFTLFAVCPVQILVCIPDASVQGEKPNERPYNARQRPFIAGFMPMILVEE